MAEEKMCRRCGLRIARVDNGAWCHTVSGDKRCTLYASPVAAWGGR